MNNINHFKIEKSKKIDGIYIFTPSFGKDDRGIIYTSFYEDNFKEFLPKNLKFKHDKFSSSNKSVLRGIHGDAKSWKLISCVYGEIYQVVVDLRKESPTYKTWQSFSISKDRQSLIMIPPGCGNAYYVKSDEAVYHYKLAYDGDYIDHKDQFTVAWNSKDLNIDWPCKNPILSGRDNK